MKLAEAIAKKQEEEREACLRQILDSPAKRKLIVAGPGTGKTFTFKQVLKLAPDVDGNLAVTFINKLVDDLSSSLIGLCRSATFHGYCAGLLHECKGGFSIEPQLPSIIESDAAVLSPGLSGFDSKFRSLQVGSDEIKFYLKRGDYYSAVGFDDAIFQLYLIVKSNPNVLPQFKQIVVDEFQDFNRLEVALIDELANRGSMLIVGDDDQAIYSDRSSSPKFLRDKAGSNEYTRFELPYCSRCPDVVVRAADAIVNGARSKGLLDGRIPKRFECYLPEKYEDSVKYPKLMKVRCSLPSVVGKYIAREIQQLDADDIAESKSQDSPYPSVLIAGQRQYLTEIEKVLKPLFPQTKYTKSRESKLQPSTGYLMLVSDRRSNLGWRILVEVLRPSGRADFIRATEDGTAMVDVLPKRFTDRHMAIVDLLVRCRESADWDGENATALRRLLGLRYGTVVAAFTDQTPDDDDPVPDDQPTVLLTSYKGCKGLSAGHVFVVGLNNGNLPLDPLQIRDVEVSQFMVALTRTRKRCHLISNRWLVVRKKDHTWGPEREPSIFLDWLPDDLIEDRGYVAAKDL